MRAVTTDIHTGRLSPSVDASKAFIERGFQLSLGGTYKESVVSDRITSESFMHAHSIKFWRMIAPNGVSLGLAGCWRIPSCQK
jgi:hypothetical protein